MASVPSTEPYEIQIDWDLDSPAASGRTAHVFRDTTDGASCRWGWIETQSDTVLPPVVKHVRTPPGLHWRQALDFWLMHSGSVLRGEYRYRVFDMHRRVLIDSTWHPWEIATSPYNES